MRKRVGYNCFLQVSLNGRPFTVDALLYLNILGYNNILVYFLCLYTQSELVDFKTEICYQYIQC